MNVPIETPQNHPPIYFAGGFGYDAERNSRVGEYLATQGYDVLPPLPDPDFRTADTGFSVVMDGVSEQLSRRKAVRKAMAPAAEQSISHFQRDRADELIAVIEAGGTAKIDAIFQSADALNGLLALHKRPDLFQNVVLAYPAGIIKQPKPVAAARGIAKSMKAGRESRHGNTDYESFEAATASADAAARLRKNGGMVTATAATLSYHGPLLSEVRRRADAPGVSLVLGTDDWMIRPELVLQSLKNSEDVDYILLADTKHGIKGRTEVMNDVLRLFPLMEARKAARMEARRTGTEPAVEPLRSRIIASGNIAPARVAELQALAEDVDYLSA